MNTTVDIIALASTVLFLVGIPALVGGFIGEVFYAGRAIRAYQQHEDPTSLVSSNWYYWFFAWILIVRKSTERDKVMQIASVDSDVARDLRLHSHCRRVVQFSLMALFVAFLI